jgi:lipoyl(octanoyl) transferase
MVPVEGRVPYREGLEWQRELARARIEGRLHADFVLLLEHEPVLTLGRGSRLENVVANPDLLSAAGVEAVEVERGGDVTYHGPGQIVGYPILDLGRYRRDLHWYLRQLEEVIIVALSELGIGAFRVTDYTGVWVGDEERRLHVDRAAGRIRKIASIGVHVSHWVTWHGFALNVTREPLRNFGLIVPCGIDDVRMTSLEAEGCQVDDIVLKAALAYGFVRAFEAQVRIVDPIAPGDTPELADAAANPEAGPR